MSCPEQRLASKISRPFLALLKRGVGFGAWQLPSAADMLFSLLFKENDGLLGLIRRLVHARINAQLPTEESYDPIRELSLSGSQLFRAFFVLLLFKPSALNDRLRCILLESMVNG